MALSLFDHSDTTQAQASALVAETLQGADDGELFVEKRETQGFSFDDGKLKSASFDETQGFGLRSVSGETAAYAHSTEISKAALLRASELCKTMTKTGVGQIAAAPERTNQKLYSAHNPVEAIGFAEKVSLLKKVDAFARGLGPEVVQVSVSLNSDWQSVEIIRGDGQIYRDVRPLVRFGVSIVAARGGAQGQGSHGLGGRGDPSTYLTDELWQGAAREAYRQSLVSLDAKPAPAGEVDVMLGPGWPGILLHEAIGHGLEGDFNRKGTSAFAGLMGQRIAAPGITVVDDGTLPDRRGSISIDDEGTPSNCTTLIEDGVLVGFMQDRLNARLMGVKPTGNGRRQSYAHAPMPRMTNTYMLAGDRHPDEILASSSSPRPNAS